MLATLVPVFMFHTYRLFLLLAIHNETIAEAINTLNWYELKNQQTEKSSRHTRPEADKGV